MLAILGVAVLAAACGREAAPVLRATDRPAAGGRPVVEVHRSASCACCKRYEAYLMDRGFEVRSVLDEETSALKDSLGIPHDVRSCHTALADRYFVEGHVPAEAIEALLETAPDIEGIALPGMPLGSPGMDGQREGPLVIYAISGGVLSEFATL